jgi:hypothetical protein
MKLSDLNNETVYTYRLGRAGRTNVEWRPWRQGKMYVKFREQDLPKSSRRGKIGLKGELLTIIPVDAVDWAESGEKDYCGNGCFVTEDYYLEIQGLD